MPVTLHFAFCILHFALPLALLLPPMPVTLHFALLLALLLPHSSVLRSWSETSAQSVKSVDDNSETATLHSGFWYLNSGLSEVWLAFLDSLRTSLTILNVEMKRTAAVRKAKAKVANDRLNSTLTSTSA
jgi:hypothetical protein